MPNHNITISIIFVLYNSYDAMQRFLEEQNPTSPQSIKLIIVDNTPHNSLNYERLKSFEKFSNVQTIIAKPENLGYAGAADFAMRMKPELYDCDYVLLSNTDLIYSTADFHNTLTETHSEHENTGAIAPRLIHPNKKSKSQLHYVTAPSYSKYRKLVKIFSSYPLALIHRLGADAKRFMGFQRDTGEIPREIFAPHGALMILTKKYFERTSGFKHPAFLFCEEITIGAECRDANLTVIYEPKLSYSHDNHGSMGAIPSRKIVKYLHDSHLAILPRLEKL